VNFRIGGIVELLRDPGIRRFLRQRFCAGNRALHAFRTGRQDEFRAQHRQQRAPFQRHRFGHGKNQLVPFRGGDERQRDAGVAARGLDDDGFLFENTALLGILNHRHADAVLDAAERVEKFALEQNRGRHAGGDLIQFDQRGVPDGFDDVVVNASHKNPFELGLIDLVSQDCDEFGMSASGIFPIVLVLVVVLDRLNF